MPKENPKLLQNILDEAPSVETFASDFYTRNKKDIDKWLELAKARLEEWTQIDDVGLLDEYNPRLHKDKQLSKYLEKIKDQEKILPYLKHRKILDLGAGRGGMYWPIREMNPDLFDACDPEPVHYNFLKKNLPYDNVYHMGITSNPSIDLSLYDLIVLYDVWPPTWNCLTEILKKNKNIIDIVISTYTLTPELEELYQFSEIKKCLWRWQETTRREKISYLTLNRKFINAGFGASYVKHRKTKNPYSQRTHCIFSQPLKNR